MKRFLFFVLAGTLGLAARAATPAQPAQPAKAPSDLVGLSTPDEVKAVCLATRPPERLLFTGDAVARAKAKEEYVAARRAALQRLYLVRVRADGFTLGDYDAGGQTLPLDLSRPMHALDGALTLAFAAAEPLLVPLSLPAATAAAGSKSAGTARLDAYFELDDGVGAVCSGSAAAGVFTLAAVPVAFELKDGTGQLLGRVETPLADRHRAVLGGYSGTPAAVVGPVTVQGDQTDAKAIAQRLDAVTEPVRRCYVERLLAKPDAGGTVVLGVDVAATGQVDSVDFTADALHDDALHKCVDQAVRAVRFRGVAGLPTLFRVPIELKRLPR